MRNMFRKYISTLLLLTLFARVGPAQVDKVDELIKIEMERQNMPSLALAVVKDGKIVKAAGYGFANIKLQMPSQPDTIYKIASVSKQFIATGVMLLVQEGKIGVDDPISRYLDGAPQTWKAITIRHLLTHTSGLVREPPGYDPHKIRTDAEVIKSAYPLPLQFQPGEKFQYSNVGYFALGEVTRKVSGEPWTDYLDKKSLQTVRHERDLPN